MKKPIIGNRVIKTGIAVFFTALLCEFVHITPAFAVVAAIVTIEPTIHASIQKGIIRLPASMIGAAFSVLSIYLFGASPLTYTAAAFLTIVVCYKLKLHAGLIVATITAVAMIDVTHVSLWADFLARLGGSVIGIVISTIVNMVILPPDYLKKSRQQLEVVITHTNKLLNDFIDIRIKQTEGSHPVHVLTKSFQKLTEERLRLEQYIQQQQSEMRYHLPNAETKAILEEEAAEARQLTLIHYHLWNLIHAGRSGKQLHWNNEQRHHYILAAEAVQQNLLRWTSKNCAINNKPFQDLFQLYWSIEIPENPEEAYFPIESIYLYELLSINQLIEEQQSGNTHLPQKKAVLSN
ncbi:Aromatic acid exporter family member 1 [Terribacillus aidingensis]|uniref:Aromatic acid exporter family member 1 n=1 Tax=Terribacillus aidingensis TaxID=586416 RepID=A0A285P247_9BACI|nr:aromatic acid exporter family protein [Terribacillus aidingensis]SNZ15814.1 Aromatic acid exporter family member 1 [Terribacillus aidingensis]